MPQAPLYEQIIADVTTSIREGTLQPGDKLPSIAELREQYQSSAWPVRYALLPTTPPDPGGAWLGRHPAGLGIVRGPELTRSAAVGGTAMPRQPLYEQVITDVIASITSGALPPGAKLPSITELCEQYSASPTPVRLDRSSPGQRLVRGAGAAHLEQTCPSAMHDRYALGASNNHPAQEYDLENQSE